MTTESNRLEKAGEKNGKKITAGNDNDSAGVKPRRGKEDEKGVDGYEKEGGTKIKSSNSNREKGKNGTDAVGLPAQNRRMRDEGRVCISV